MQARPRVTAVNDSPEFLELVGEILTDEHYAVTLIDSDKSGVTPAIRASQPDILLLDLRLGSEGLRGWDVLHAVRRDPDLATLPVLLVSGDLDGMERVESEMGSMLAVATLRKPFTLDELSEAISTLLSDASNP
ncbi:MAG: response regulator [Candidatus Limnocylindria bacterium]